MADFAASSFWHSHSAEALRRTPLDLILFDRLSLKQEDEGARNLVLKRGQTITTPCLGNQMVCGVADYALGYCHAASFGRASILESITIVIEAKQRERLEQGIPRMILYLSGIQQSRAELHPERIMKTVYGILTGLAFRFFRLDGDHHLYISKLFATDYEDEKRQV